ncbi:MAG: Hsp70 family protein [Mariniblastus sp.]|nr:Hsp70 family protein [Mariniblastus sp.]
MSESKKQSPVGIDLGTTFSVIAYVNENGRPESVPNAEGDLLTPSTVLFDEEEVIVGKEAAKAIASELDQVAECPKRQIGQRVYDKKIAGRRYPPEALQGWILRKLKQDAMRVVGDFDQAVITVPAYFDEVRRKATQDSGMIAGIEVQDIINEPTSAAIAYGFQNGWLDPKGVAVEKTRFLVYDLGGGTFDVSIMEADHCDFKTIATDGDYQLGGRDWDQRLIDHVANAFKDEHGFDPRENSDALGKLIRDCKEAKETLSARGRASVTCAFGSSTMRVDVTRDEFLRMTQDLLDRTDFTVRQTMKQANMKWTDIDRVLLVGGSTRMPAVQDLLQSLSGSSPDNSLSPDEAVAHGAAIRSAMLTEDYRETLPLNSIRNVNSHTLGVVANEVETGLPQVVQLIPRNTPIPVTSRRIFKTHKADQESILVQIVEGESTNPADCSQIGRCTIWDLPENLPVGTPIEVKFGYEENGRLRIKVKIGGEDRRSFRYELKRANGLTLEQLESWRQYISGAGS